MDEQVGEAVNVGALLRAHAVGPVLRQLHAVAPGYVVARSAGVVGADLEPRRVDDAVELVLLAGYHDAPLGDPLHTLAVGVDEVRAGLVSRLQVLVVRSEEHTSEIPSLMRNSVGGFCLKKKTKQQQQMNSKH